jgi:hypothetical protein
MLSIKSIEMKNHRKFTWKLFNLSSRPSLKERMLLYLHMDLRELAKHTPCWEMSRFTASSTNQLFFSVLAIRDIFALIEQDGEF